MFSIFLRKKKLKIEKSFIFLSLFFIFFIYRMSVDIGTIEKLKSYTVGTTGGIILFYGLGVLSSALFACIKKNIMEIQKYLDIANLIFAVYMLFFIRILVALLIKFLPNIYSANSFLSDFLIGYQRSGNFLTIAFLLLSFLYNFLFVFNYYTKKIRNRIFINLMLVLFSVAFVLGMAFSQTVRSNMGLLNIGIMFIATVLFYIFLNLFYSELSTNRNILSVKTLFFSKTTLKGISKNYCH